jgi:hypothetical protein
VQQVQSILAKKGRNGNGRSTVFLPPLVSPQPSRRASLREVTLGAGRQEAEGKVWAALADGIDIDSMASRITEESEAIRTSHRCKWWGVEGQESGEVTPPKKKRSFWVVQS